jgi:hypothetical protein
MRFEEEKIAFSVSNSERRTPLPKRQKGGTPNYVTYRSDPLNFCPRKCLKLLTFHFLEGKVKGVRGER